MRETQIRRKMRIRRRRIKAVVLTTGALLVFGIVVLCGKKYMDAPTGEKEPETTLQDEQKEEKNQEASAPEESGQAERDDEEDTENTDVNSSSIIHPNGTTLEERIGTPEGFSRVEADAESLGAFLRSYPMKADGSPVLLYDGSRKRNQEVHAAVFELPMEEEDLQQCADSVMRVYGEYYYAKGQYDRIEFPLGGGFMANFGKWSKGNGIGLNGDSLYWKENPQNDSSYASFQRFMRMVFAYSGTLNMEEYAEPIDREDLQIGDIYIKGGSPGHVVMVVDLCENASGEKAYLLAQGYMPAQEFHVIKNPLHEDDPWYYLNEYEEPFRTAEYTFSEGGFRRFPGE